MIRFCNLIIVWISDLRIDSFFICYFWKVEVLLVHVLEISQSWTDVKLTSPQLEREGNYKLSLKNSTFQSVSSRQVSFTMFLVISVIGYLFGLNVSMYL